MGSKDGPKKNKFAGLNPDWRKQAAAIDRGRASVAVPLASRASSTISQTTANSDEDGELDNSGGFFGQDEAGEMVIAVRAAKTPAHRVTIQVSGDD